MNNNFSEAATSAVDINLIKKSVIKIIFLTIITLSLYFPVWFLKVRPFINKLKSDKKVGSALPIIVIIMTSLYFIMLFLEGFIEGFNQNNLYIGYLSNISNFLEYSLIILDIGLLIQCFKIRRILLDHYDRKINISKIATFFFEIFYLQYKINKL